MVGGQMTLEKVISLKAFVESAELADYQVRTYSQILIVDRT